METLHQRTIGKAGRIFFRNKGIAPETSRKNDRNFLLWRDPLILIMTLSGALPPPLWHSPVAIMPYCLYVFVEKFPVQAIPGHCNAPPPPMGAGLAQGGDRYLKRRFFQSIMFFSCNISALKGPGESTILSREKTSPGISGQKKKSGNQPGLDYITTLMFTL